MPFPIMIAMAAMSAAAAMKASSDAASASKANSAANVAANQANIQAGENADTRGMVSAQVQRSRDELGSTDAAGNVTRYVPGRGWVTELSTEQQQLLDQSHSNEFYNQTQGERIRRTGLEKNAEQQGHEGQTATALLEQFRNRGITDPTALSNQLYAAGEIGRNEQGDRLAEANAKTIARTGNQGAIGNILSARAREGNKATEQARREAALIGPDAAASRDAQSATNTGNLYNMFAQRASNPTGIGFSPANVSSPPPANTSGTTNAIINAYGRRPVQYDYQQPDFSTANSTLAIGNALTGAMGNYQAQKNFDTYNKTLASQDRVIGNSGF